MDYDVIVVGAGPAGSTAARLCAEDALQVLLLDKAAIPRFKSCAGGITRRGYRLLDTDVPDKLLRNRAYGAKVVCGRHMAYVRDEEPIAYLTRRSEFDEHLVKAAVKEGVELSESTCFNKLERKRGFAEVSTSKGVFSCNMVVGADGASSRVAGYVRKPHKPHQIGVTLEADIPYDGARLDDLEFHLATAPSGYSWIFPKDDHVSVGMGGVAGKFKNPRECFTSFLSSQGFPPDSVYAGHMIPAGGFKREIVSDNIILAGDAAGFVDPLFGEGITFAVNSGICAAKAISMCSGKKDFGRRGLRIYERMCRKDFLDDLRYGLWSAYLIHRYPGFFTRMLCRPKAGKKLLELVSGETSYRSLLFKGLYKWPRYLGGEILHLK